MGVLNLRSLLGYSEPVGYNQQSGVPDMDVYGTSASEAPSYGLRGMATSVRRRLQGNNYSRRPTTFPPKPDDTFTVAGGVRG